jgi:hypothetical protein
MATVLRFLILIPLGFLLACAGAAFALIWPFLGQVPALEADPVFWFEAATGFVLQAVQIGTVSFVPWALFMAASEALGLRSLVLHALAGVAGAFAVLRLAYGTTAPHASVQTAMIVAGLAFALIYWLVAGRGAGRWRRARLEKGSGIA